MKLKWKWQPGQWLKTAQKLFKTTVKALRMVFRKFINDQCLIRAAGLAFSFLLAFVPLLALVLSLFSGFGAFDTVIDSLQNFVVEAMLPVQQETILASINQLTANTRALGIFGLITFLFASIIFLNNVENNFNSIWRTVSHRKYVARFTSHTSILVFGTLLLGASFSLSGAVNKFLSFLNPARDPLLNRFFLFLFPFLFMLLALMLLIMLIPAIRVRFKSALIGALVGSLLWEVAKRLFSFWVNSSIQYSIIYGTLAVFPIFLLWIYIGWLIALLALEITCIHQYRENPWLTAGWRNEPPALQMLVGFQIFVFIARRFREGKPPLNLYTLAGTFSMNFNDVQFIGESLVRGALVLPFIGGSKLILLARDLSSIKLSEVIECLYGQIPAKIRSKSWEPALTVMHALKAGAFESLKETTMLEFLSAPQPAEKK